MTLIRSGCIWPVAWCVLRRSELDAWVSHPKQTIQATVFDSSDGVSSHRYTGGYGAVVAKSADGKLWFLRRWRRQRHRSAASAVQQASAAGPHRADRRRRQDHTTSGHGMRLPPNVRNLRIEYTALSLVAPEKIHFKYKLEGQNRNWHEVINERHATYTNLPPRNYRFRVMASQQQRRVERNRRHAGVLHRPGVLSDDLVLRVVRGRLSGYALGAVPAARCIRSRGSSRRKRRSGRASRASCTTRCCRAFRLR